jgi:hypothetical protein
VRDAITSTLDAITLADLVREEYRAATGQRLIALAPRTQIYGSAPSDN